MDPSREHIALACGIARDEGLMVAYLPPLGAVMQEYPAEFGGTLYAQDGVVIDAIAADGKPVKWWKVRIAARVNRLAIVEPVWQGAAEDFRLGMFPATQGKNGEKKLHMRAWQHGPWISIDISKESNDLR